MWVQSVGSGIQGSGFWVQGLGFRVQGYRFRVLGALVIICVDLFGGECSLECVAGGEGAGEGSDTVEI